MSYLSGEAEGGTIVKSEIIRLANQLCGLLEQCDDEEFVDMVCCAVSSNSYIDDAEHEDYEHEE